MEEINNDLQKEKVLISWKTKAFLEHERNWKWYLILVLVLTGVIGYSAFVQDWFIIVIALILTAILLWYIRQKPDEKEYKISQLGLYEGKMLYSFNEIHSFWLLLKPDVKQLNVMFNKKYLPLLSIIIPEGVDPLTIKTILGHYIPEKDNSDESLIDFLSRKFKI